MHRFLPFLLLCLLFSSCGPGGIALIAVLMSSGKGEEKKPSEPAFRIVEVYPSDGAENVDPKANVLLRFSMMLNSGSVNSGYFQLLDENSSVILTDVLWHSPTEVIMEPQNPLEPGATYTIYVSADVVSIGGERLGRDYTFRFRVTSGAPLDIPLYVVSTVPKEGEEIPHPPVIFVTFSEAVIGMDATSVTLEDGDGSPVTVNVSGSGAHYDISPSGVTSAGDFKLIIDGSKVMSEDGSLLGKDFVLQFRTVDLTPLSVRIPERVDVNPENCINSNNETAVTVEVQLPSTTKSTDTLCLIFDSYDITAAVPAIDGGGLETVEDTDCSSLPEGSLSLYAFVLRNGWMSQPSSQTILKDTVPMELQVTNPASMPQAHGALYHPLKKIFFEGVVSEDGDVLVDFNGTETAYPVTVVTGFTSEYTIEDVAYAYPVTIRTRDNAWNTQVVYDFNLWRVGGQSGKSITSSSSITVHIYDSDTLQPVKDAYVIIGDYLQTGYTDAEGLFTCSVSISPVVVTAIKDGYNISSFVGVTRDHLSLPLGPQNAQRSAFLRVATPPVTGYGHCNHMVGMLNDTDPSDGECSFKITARRQYSISVFGDWEGGITGIQYLLHNEPLEPGASNTHSLSSPTTTTPSQSVSAASSLTLPDGVYLPQYQQPFWRGDVTVSVAVKNETRRLLVGRSDLNDSLSTGTGSYLPSAITYFEIPEALDYALTVRLFDIHGRSFNYRTTQNSPFSGVINFTDPLEPPEIKTPCKGEVVSDALNFSFSWENSLQSKGVEGFYMLKLKNLNNGAEWLIYSPDAIDSITPIQIPDWYSTPVLNYGDDVSVRVTAFESMGSWTTFSIADAMLRSTRVSTSTERRLYLFDADSSQYLTFIGMGGKRLPGTLTIRIVDMATGAPLNGVYVYTNNNTTDGVVTNKDGVAVLTVDASSVNVTAVKSGYSYITVLDVSRNFITLPVAQIPDPSNFYVLYGEAGVSTANGGFAAGRSVFGKYYEFFNIDDSTGLSDPVGHNSFSSTPDNFSFASPLSDTDVILSIFDTSPLSPSKTIKAGEVLRETASPYWDDANDCWRWEFPTTIDLRKQVFTPMPADTRPGGITTPLIADGVFVQPLAIIGDLFFGKGRVRIGVGATSGSGTSFNFGFSHILPSDALGDYDFLALQIGASGTNADGSRWDIDHMLAALESFPSEYDAQLKKPPTVTYPQHNTPVNWWDRRLKWDFSAPDETAFFNIMLEEETGAFFWQVIVTPKTPPQTIILPQLPSGYRGPQSGDVINLELIQMFLSPFNREQWIIRLIFDLWEDETEHRIRFTYSP